MSTYMSVQYKKAMDFFLHRTQPYYLGYTFWNENLYGSKQSLCEEQNHDSNVFDIFPVDLF